MFECQNCLKSFSTKQQYERHMNRTRKCKKDEINIITYKPFMCNFCSREFTHKHHLETHLASYNTPCYIIRSLKKNLGNTVINNNITNQNIEQINNTVIEKPQILFLEHGKEKIDHITREIILQLLQNYNFNDMCCELIKLMYFNKNVPENSNWMIAYPKNAKAGVEYNYTTEQFERKCTIDIVDDKFSNMINLLQHLIEEIYQDDEINNTLTSHQKRNISRYDEHVGMLEISKESPELYAQIREIAYTHRVISTSSWKAQGLSGNHLSIKF